jgi:putative SOS response-associated peptidase YedK
VGDEKRLGPMRWGFVPTAAKDPKLAPINARAETLATSPTFRDAFLRHRCLVVADGFYEWRKDGRRKTPFFIHLRSSRPFAFAGIWSLRRSEARDVPRDPQASARQGALAVNRQIALPWALAAAVVSDGA